MLEMGLCQPQPWHRESVHLPAGSPGPLWDTVNPGSPGQAVSCRRFEHKAMAVAQTKVITLEQVLPTLLDPSQGVGLSKPPAFALPCPRG